MHLRWAVTYGSLLSGLTLAAPAPEDPTKGYQTQPEISHIWGQYSPVFSVPSTISADVPDHCRITFAQLLSRHGARDPTASKTASYSKTIAQIKKSVTSFPGKYSFLKDFVYNLGADQLTAFGEQEMVNSGSKYYTRYQGLTKHFDPFIRASSEDRVVVSAQKFAQGYHTAKKSDPTVTDKDNYPYPIVILSEAEGQNNTLSHGLCTNFETKAPYNAVASSAQQTFSNAFVPAITARLNAGLAGANLTDTQTIYIMDLCPFETVASPTGEISAFCALFGEDEWRSYDYYQSLGKYYGYGAGNPLGPTNGVGFVNELIARMTNKPVDDHTSVNQTLDTSHKTFPIGGGKVLYTDFSHDNDMTAIFFAMGLYASTTPLSNTSVQDTGVTKGYSAAWTVPFAARAYIEKMSCSGVDEELVRVLVNDRVIPLRNCGADSLGRCTLSKWVDSQSFSKKGGLWDQCFS
ncbi:MAG: hypothetical protein M1814_006929 [Vezdaea aestivalis]|nr:MAG: hypothetical protein M1814_006929 [Vezdaea aestivalis]